MMNKDILRKVRFRCHRMHNFLRAYYGKPIGPLLGFKQSVLRSLLESPTPSFYENLSNLYHYAHIDFDENLLIEFRNAVLASDTNKK